VIEADEAIKNEDGEVVAVHCRIIEGTVGNDPADGIKPKGVVHWVSASKGIPAEIRLYDRLFTEPEPGSGGVDFMEHVNRDSLKVLQGCLVEPGLVTAVAEQNIQFEREGYFVADRFDHSSDKLVFNKTIGLRDTWAKLENS
jgi:glutaminyl-tRNA synthetase